jgi:RpiR family carbohydrate utilization transcriptional regulator
MLHAASIFLNDRRAILRRLYFMTDVSCIYLIRKMYDTLSKTEKKIADFVLANPGKVVTPSIEELSDAIGISESSMVRFARKLGYSGYQRFRIALARETIAPSSQLFEAPINPDDDEVDIVFSAAMATLDATRKKLDRTAVSTAAEKIVSSTSLTLLGLGGSNIVSRDAFHKIVRTGIRCNFAEDFHLQLMIVSQLKPEDTVLVTSHTGVNQDTLALVEEVREKGCTLIVLTSNPRSAIARAADILLTVWTASSTSVAESFSARLAHLTVIDILYVEIMKKLKETGVANLQNMRDAIARRRT